MHSWPSRVTTWPSRDNAAASLHRARLHLARASRRDASSSVATSSPPSPPPRTSSDIACTSVFLAPDHGSSMRAALPFWRPVRASMFSCDIRTDPACAAYISRRFPTLRPVQNPSITPHLQPLTQECAAPDHQPLQTMTQSTTTSSWTTSSCTCRSSKIGVR